jgi:hypothetical protein
VTFQLTWRRRLAQQLLRHSAALLASERSMWAAAMRAEVQHINDDGEALGWALSSVRAGFTERLRALRVHKMPSLHALGVLWIVMLVASSAFNVSIVVATRLRLHGVASAMGRLIAGFRYDRFVPFADAMPTGLFVLMGLVVVLFSAALSLSLRRRPAAFSAFCSALGLSLAAWLYQLGIPAYVQAMSLQHRWRIGICFVLTAGALGAVRFFGAAPKPSMQRLDERPL